MKAAVLRVLAAALLCSGLLATASQPARADTQDFTFTSFHGDYTLTRDSNKVGHLHVVENLQALFPDFDQNHGIIRALPASYQGHNIHLKIDSVADQAGTPLLYTTSTSNGNLLLQIGDSTIYVRGAQTYVITYDQDNVTANPPGYDGLFWDVNGDQWQQKFGQVTATINVGPSLVDARDTSHDRCFTGARGSTDQNCTVSTSSGHDSTTVAAAGGLGANQTLTYELGFKPGTFAAYHVPLSDILVFLAKLLGFIVLPIGAAVVFTVGRWWKYGRDPADRGVIVPEYVPPADISVLMAGTIIKQSFKPAAVTSTILDLAVRRYLKIYEVQKKQLVMFNSHTYELELTQAPSDLKSEERQVVTIIFGPSPKVGDRVSIDALSDTLYVQAAALGKQVNQSAADTGYFRINPDKARNGMYTGGIILLVGAFFVFSIFHWLGGGLAGAGLVLLLMAQIMPARTDQGVTARDQLLGLKMYMTVAEADRIKALQSPHGALTEKIDVTDKSQLIKVNERLLPYAMLFGIEKAWIKEFASLYDQPPDWYAGSGAFNAAYFASTMSGFATASSASFSPPSSSGGGGSAGGGGGGGGGGGW